MVLPSGVKEYSTAVVFALVTRLCNQACGFKMAKSSASMRREINSTCRRSSPWRCGLSLSEKKDPSGSICQ